MSDTQKTEFDIDWQAEYIRLDRENQEFMRAIYEKQQRDKLEQTTEYRIINEATGTVHRDNIADYDEARTIAQLYDNAAIQTRPAYPWKTVTPSTSTDTGN